MSFSRTFRYLLIGSLMVGALSSVSFIQAQSTGLPTETKEQRDQRMAWWREARFGMFIHWGALLLAGRHMERTTNAGDRPGQLFSRPRDPSPAGKPK